MRRIALRLPLMLALASSFSVLAPAQGAKTPTLRGILLEQLQTTHNEKDWFVPANQAIDGLTAEQASWKDASGNHSIGQLTVHLIFWNKRELEKFQGTPPAKFTGENTETFNSFDNKNWTAAVKELDDVLTGLEKVVATMDDKKLNAWASEIAHIGTHNAYHTGQIIFIRKQKGWWDAEKGVK
jgi:uncharacterized damage-inducible protein DinB